MRLRSIHLLVFAAFFCLGSQAMPAQHETETDLKAEVPALKQMHSVIFPLWHQAWPERDVETMKRFLPDVQKHLETLKAAVLPGILRDKKTQWDQGVAALEAAAKAYQAAAAADQAQGLVDAVEELHARFEALVRIVRPVMKELDAYHVVLYRIYHHHLPGQERAQLREAAVQLAERAAALVQAEMPKRVAGKAEALTPAIARLARLTEELQTFAQQEAAWDQVVKAVEAVHTQYRALEALFD